MTPIRIQRKRVKGWKMPENTVSVTRPGEFGNPFEVGRFYKLGAGSGKSLMGYLGTSKEYADSSYTEIKTNEQAVEMYREYLNRYPMHPDRIEKLKGKNLACWCKVGEPCHADVLLEVVNK